MAEKPEEALDRILDTVLAYGPSKTKPTKAARKKTKSKKQRIPRARTPKLS